MTQADNNPQAMLKQLSQDAINRGDPVLNIILSRIGKDNKWRFVFLAALSLSMFIYFMAVTLMENRFYLHSLKDNDNYLGMSFMGDTMVWPYFFLVPLIFYFIQRAISKTISLLNNTSNNIRRTPDSLAQYNRIIGNAERMLQYRGNWHYGYKIAILLGLIFWAYNTITCYKPDILVSPIKDLATSIKLDWLAASAANFHAYTTDTPIHIPPKANIGIEKFPGREQLFISLEGPDHSRKNINGNLSIISKTHTISWQSPMRWRDYLALASFSQEPAWQKGIKELFQQTRGHKELLNEPVNIRKWDTELQQAPLSWFSARIWVLVMGYGILPLLFLRVCNLLYVIYTFYKQLLDNDALIIEPLSTDEQRNLHTVTNTVLLVSYILGVFLLCLLLSFAKEGMEADWHNYLLTIPAIPMLLILFIWPLFTISKHIRYYKKQQLANRAPVLEALYREVDEIASQPHDNPDNKTRLDVLKESIALQERRLQAVQSLAEWPMPRHTLRKFSASVFLPPLIAIANKLLAGILAIVNL